jgi:DNA-binding NarL/FixJ family response regulator
MVAGGKGQKQRPGKVTGAQNRRQIRLFLAAYLGATNRDIARALGLSEMCVGRHVRALRAEWKGTV